MHIIEKSWRMLFSCKSQSFTEEIGATVADVDTSVWEDNWHSTVQLATKAGLERTRATCSSCLSHAYTASVTCMSLIWPTSWCDFPVNSCLKPFSTLEWQFSCLLPYVYLKDKREVPLFAKASISQLQFSLWRARAFKKSLSRQPWQGVSEQNRKMCCLQLGYWLEALGSWTANHPSALHTQCPVLNYLHAFLSSCICSEAMVVPITVFP